MSVRIMVVSWGPLILQVSLSFLLSSFSLYKAYDNGRKKIQAQGVPTQECFSDIKGSIMTYLSFSPSLFASSFHSYL